MNVLAPPPQPTGLCWVLLDAWKDAPLTATMPEALRQRINAPHADKPAVDETLMRITLYQRREAAINFQLFTSRLFLSDLELIKQTRAYLQGH